MSSLSGENPVFNINLHHLSQVKRDPAATSPSTRVFMAFVAPIPCATPKFTATLSCRLVTSSTTRVNRQTGAPASLSHHKTFNGTYFLRSLHPRTSFGDSSGKRPPHDRRNNHNDGDPFGNPQPISYTASMLWASRRYSPYMQRRTNEPFLKSLEHFLRSIRISHILLAINVTVFAIQALYSPGLLMAGAKVNSAIAAGEYYRLLSPMFLHASISHLLVNSFSLNSTGPSVESWFGKKRFLSLYVMSGLAGNLLSYFFCPTPAVGASGAIFGLVGASAVILGRHHKMLGPRARRGLQSLVYIVLLNFGMGLTPGSRIDNFGHLGGFLGGIGFSYLAGPRLVAKLGRSGKLLLRDEPILSVAVAELRGRLKRLGKALNGR